MRLRAFFLVLLLGSAAVAACTDSREAPFGAGAEASFSRAPGSPALTSVKVLKRLDPLAAPISVTQSIGNEGGRISIPEAGIQVDIPSKAIAGLGKKETVDITVTALRGRKVAYEFEPHGLQFKKPVRIIQDTRVTTEENHPSSSLPQGAYFPDPSLLGDSTASVSEFQATDVDRHGHKIVWSIEHFSGYLLASGVRGNSQDGNGDGNGNGNGDW
jgi:hypothetical protein